MALETSPRDVDADLSDQTASDRRSQTRVPVSTHVRLVRAGAEERFVAKNQDLSWGGASLLLPVEACELGDAVIVELPWAQGESFCAHAEVIRVQTIDEHHCLVGVRFSELLVGDEERLQRLIGMLMDQQQTDQPVSAVADRIELYFIDREDMYSTLSEVRSGRMEVTSFRSYRLNQSIAFAVAKVGHLPVLRLRARIIQQRAVESTEDRGDPQIFRIELVFEHPLDDLKRAVDPLIERLDRKRREALDSAA